MKKIKKLTLRKETLAQLDKSQLRQVDGAFPSLPSCFCSNMGTCGANSCITCTQQTD